MLALFYIFIGVAIGVSFWQITRILNLRGVIATDKDNDRQGKYFILFGIFIYALNDLLLNWNECFNVARISFLRG